jgi:hypothetical protein
MHKLNVISELAEVTFAITLLRAPVPGIINEYWWSTLLRFVQITCDQECRKDSDKVESAGGTVTKSKTSSTVTAVRPLHSFDFVTVPPVRKHPCKLLLTPPVSDVCVH